MTRDSPRPATALHGSRAARGRRGPDPGQRCRPSASASAARNPTTQGPCRDRRACRAHRSRSGRAGGLDHDRQRAQPRRLRSPEELTMDPLERTSVASDPQALLRSRRGKPGLGAGRPGPGPRCWTREAAAGRVGSGRQDRVSTSLPAPHFAPKAKRVIYMHMEGAPSQLDLYDYKPGLRQRFDQDLPDSIRQGQRLTGMTSGRRASPSRPRLQVHRYANAQDGVWLSELMPHTAPVAHELCFIHSMHTEAINHEPASPSSRPATSSPGGRHSAPGYQLRPGQRQRQPADVRGADHPGLRQHAGALGALLGQRVPAQRAPGLQAAQRRRARALSEGPRRRETRGPARGCSTWSPLNEREFQRPSIPRSSTRIAQYEMAYRMQMSVPELTDFSDEDPETLDMYGPRGEEARHVRRQLPARAATRGARRALRAALHARLGPARQPAREMRPRPAPSTSPRRP
jgi:hypothetical protein